MIPIELTQTRVTRIMERERILSRRTSGEAGGFFLITEVPRHMRRLPARQPSDGLLQLFGLACQSLKPFDLAGAFARVVNAGLERGF
jgi:hypothetical protein